MVVAETVTVGGGWRVYAGGLAAGGDGVLFVEILEESMSARSLAR